MSKEQPEGLEWDVRAALVIIKCNRPRWKGPDEDGVGEFEPYDSLHAVETLSEALNEWPEVVARMANLSDPDHAVLAGQRVHLLLRNELGREPTKGELMSRLEQDFPEDRKVISPNDPIPPATLTRYLKKCRLSHLEQDRGWGR